MAVITDVADAVVAELNAGSFSLPFTAERLYLPVFELADMQALHVTVVPKSVATDAAARTQNQQDYAIDVAVQQKLSSTANALIDELVTLVEELADHFRFRRLENYPDAIWLKTEQKPVYAPEHLEQLRQFTSLFTLMFRVIR